MEDIFLREMTKNDKKAILDYIDEFIENGSEITGMTIVKSCKTFQDLLVMNEKNKNIPFISYDQDKVASCTFLLIRKSDEKILGAFTLRKYLTKSLDDSFAGNIEFGIRPSERKKGYATEGIKLLLEKCRSFEMKSVRLGCSTKNIASRKATIANGGKLIGHIESLVSQDYYQIDL